MLEAGFVDVVERRIAVPGGVWPADPKQKRLGRVLNADWGDVMEGLSMSMLGRGLNMGPKEVQQVNALVLKDLKNAEIRWFSPL